MLEKIYRVIFWTIWPLICLLFLTTCFHYKGNLWTYILFSLSLNSYLYLGFSKSRTFFDTFLALFFWLGYWLKMSYKVSFSKGIFHEPVGNFDYSPQSFDETSLVVSIGIGGLLLARFFRERFVFNYEEGALTKTGMKLYGFIKENEKLIYRTFLGIVILVAGLNAWLGIYQRGSVPRITLPMGISGLVKWLLLFGLASFGSLLIHSEILYKKTISLKVIFLGLFETFLSNTSMLSRGMILNSTGIGIGVLEYLKRKLVTMKFRTLFLTVLGFGLLFSVSVFSVHHMRSYLFVKESISLNIDKLGSRASKLGHSTKVLFIDRWVGMEGIAAVTSYSDKGWTLWKDAWKEKYKDNGTSYYDEHINRSNYINYSYIDDVHFISLPGILAFFYYPGSKIFLFFAMFALGLFGSVIEWAAFRFSGRNLIFCSLIAQVVAYRYAHFGYVPSRSYLLFGSIFLTILIVWGAERLLLFIEKRSQATQQLPEQS